MAWDFAPRMLCVCAAVVGAAHCATAAPLDVLTAAAPRTVDDLLALDAAAFQRAAIAVDDATFAAAQLPPPSGLNRRGPSPLSVVRTALDAKARVDRLLEQVLALRTTVTSLPAEPPDDPQRRQAARGFLRAATVLIDLSGRLRYLQNDVVRVARTRMVDAGSREQLAQLFLEYESTVGATQSTDDLFTFPGRTRYHELLLRLIAASGQTSLLPQVVRYLDDLTQPAPMRLFAAEIIRVVGLPQPPRPNPIEANLPDPAIMPDEFYQLIDAIDPLLLDEEGQSRRHALLKWSDDRRKRGVIEDSYRIGSFEVRPGDWLLMRNPSPYNLFTDLSPGLFTHVGVVAAETGTDGVRRFVIVDVPERGDRVPAVNVEIYLERTLHYFFLRDADAEAAAAMARAAGEVIDNPSQFDLNFRRDRVEALAKKPLDGVKIHTYCAGLLWLCALQTDVSRDEYFPLAEKQAGGRTVENVAKMGLSLGNGFLSPSGALYSPRMQIIGKREPMYDPRREVEEAVFDQFAKLLVVREMEARGDWYDALRLKTAEAAKANPLLAQALASAAGVAIETDLVAAAKAAAVVETLDEVALSAGADFQAARDALRGASAPAPATADERNRRAAAARRHAALVQSVQQGRTSPRSARQALVNYYIQAGHAELERRFFNGN